MCPLPPSQLIRCTQRQRPEPLLVWQVNPPSAAFRLVSPSVKIYNNFETFPLI